MQYGESGIPHLIIDSETPVPQSSLHVFAHTSITRRNASEAEDYIMDGCGALLLRKSVL